MTKKGYVIFFICLWMLFGASRRDLFGFKPMVEGADNSMAMGNNTAQAVIIVIVLWFLFKFLRMAFARYRQQAAPNTSSETKSRWALLKTGAVVVPLFMLVFQLGTTMANRRADQNKAESERIESVMMENIRKQNSLAFPSVEKLSTLHLLQPDSFKTIESIKVVLGTLDTAEKELQSFDTVREKMVQAGELIIENSSLPRSSKEDMRAGYRDSMTSAETKKLQEDRLSAQQAYYERTATLYSFTLEHFLGYKIEKDATGKLNILFYSNANLATYRQLLAKVTEAAEAYNKANNALMARVPGFKFGDALPSR